MPIRPCDQASVNLLEYYLTCGGKLDCAPNPITDEYLNFVFDFICKDQDLNREDDRSIIMLMTFNLLGHNLYGEQVRRLLNVNQSEQVHHALIATHILKLAINHLKSQRDT